MLLQFDEALGCADVQNPGREGVYNCVLPDPWRCLALAHRLILSALPCPHTLLPNCFSQRLGVYPLSTTIRVATTAHGIEEGLNAGMWTVAVYNTGTLFLRSAVLNDKGPSGRKSLVFTWNFHQLGTAGLHS